MGCKDAVSAEPLLKNHTFNCLTFAETTRQPFNNNFCLFCALALNFNGIQNLEDEISKAFDAFIKKMDGINASQFRGVHMNDLPVAEEIVTNNILLYDIDIVIRNIIGELARHSMKKLEKTVRLLRYHNYKCNVNIINAVIKSFRYPSCDTFINKASSSKRHQTTCSDRVEILYPKNVYQTRETIFDRVVSLGITYDSEQKLYKMLAVFDCEPICSQQHQLQRQKHNDFDREAYTNISIHLLKSYQWASFFPVILTLTTSLRLLSQH